MKAQEIFSKEGKFIIFKHSSICQTSHVAKDEVIEYQKQEESLEVIRIDVIREEKLKMEIAEKYGVEHESPQILVIDDQKCVDDFDHGDVTLERLKEVK